MRWILLLALLITGAVVAAQDTATYPLDNVLIQLSVPSGWQVTESQGSIEVSSREGYGQLFRFDVTNDCGQQSPDPAAPSLSCDPSALETLNYFMPVVWGYDADASEKQTESAGDTDFVNTSAYYAGAKPAGNGVFLVFVWQPGEPDEATRADIQALLASASAATVSAQTAASTPSLIATDDGWTLDIGVLDVGDVSRLVMGQDSLIYAYTDAGAIVRLDENGTFQTLLMSTYFDQLKDFAVTPDGTLWVLTQTRTVAEVDKSGDFVQELNFDTGNGYVPLAIEADSDGDLYLLEQAQTDAPARVQIVDTDGNTLNTFDVSSDDFAFQGDPMLSMASFGVGPDKKVYVFSESAMSVRLFDNQGAIRVSKLPYDVPGNIDYFSFDNQSRVYVQVLNEKQVMLYSPVELSARALDVASDIVLVLPSNDAVYGSGLEITRQSGVRVN